MMSMRCWLWPLGLIALSGCGFLLRHQVDQEIRDLSAKNEDGVPTCGLVNSLPPPPPASGGVAAVGERRDTRSLTVAAPLQVGGGELQQVVYDEQEKPVPQRLYIPKGLPGADAPDIDIPEDPKEKAQYFARLYPPIPDLPPMPPPAPGPEGNPLSLADLQRLGETYSPTIKTALAAVEAAKAAAYDVGMYPNPTIAYEHDTVETGPAGYPGGYFDQLIKTGGKLTVKQAAATMDVLSARLDLRRAKADLWYQVRSNYFAVLIALQGIRYNEALFKFSEDLYERHVTRMSLPRAGVARVYEPMQLRPLVLQARLGIIQARNQYLASWRQLAAAIGLPDMPPSQLAGSLDVPMPVFDYNNVLTRLENHTDVRKAFVSVQKAKYNLRYEKLIPLPDMGVRALVQKDYTTPPNQVVQSAIMYMTVPLWDQNRGGIRQAEWQLAQAAVGPPQARNALINTLADAFNRYLTSRQQVDITMQQIQDLLRVYKGAWLQHQIAQMEVSFSDLWPIQQAIGGFIGGYLTALGSLWQASVDVANLVQTEDFYQSGQRQDVVPLPVLDDLMTPLRNYPQAPIKPAAVQRNGPPPPAGGTVVGQPIPGIRPWGGATPSQPSPKPSAPESPAEELPSPQEVRRRSESTEPKP